MERGWIRFLKPGFNYTTNATTTTQKQSDYKVEQSSFTLIALFCLEIGRCRGRNWLNGSKNGTVLDLIVIYKKKGTIKYSNKIDRFGQMAEMCQFEVK